jgi:Leucine-rich repeat (LRR) protein
LDGLASYGRLRALTLMQPFCIAGIPPVLPRLPAGALTLTRLMLNSSSVTLLPPSLLSLNLHNGVLSSACLNSGEQCVDSVVTCMLLEIARHLIIFTHCLQHLPTPAVPALQDLRLLHVSVPLMPIGTCTGLQHLTRFDQDHSDAPFARWPCSLRYASVMGTDVDASALQDATALHGLSLWRPPNVPASHSRLLSLRWLQMSGTAIGQSLGALRWLGELEQLYLKDCPTPHAWPSTVLARFTKLTLSNCGLRDIPAAVGRMVGLRELRLERETECSDVTVLSQLTRLSCLSLSGCAHVQHVPPLPLLSQLDLSGTAVRQLPLFLCLTSLHMKRCNLAAIPDILPQLTTLYCLDLDGNEHLAEADLEALCPLAPRLWWLCVSGCGLRAVPACFKQARVKCCLRRFLI